MSGRNRGGSGKRHTPLLSVYQKHSHDGGRSVSDGGRRASESGRPVRAKSSRHLVLGVAAGVAVFVVFGIITYSFLPRSPESINPRNSASYKTSDHLPFRRGHRTIFPAFGIFPKGCKWREVREDGSSTVEYEYWDNVWKRWISKQPSACVAHGSPAPGPAGFKFLNGTPRTEVLLEPAHCVYMNLWYNNGRWYALVDGDRFVPSWRFSRNQEIVTLHVSDASEFVKSIKWRVVTGDTLLFDFIYFIHPTAIGHWWEMMGPLYSTLKNIAFKRPCDQFVLLHLKRTHFMEWVRAVVAVGLGVGRNKDLPSVYLQEETDNIFQQITQPLEGVPADEWLVFERMLIVRDLATGGKRTFLNSSDARDFRAAVYHQYGLPEPVPRPEVPRVLTFQRKRSNRRVLNEEALLALLRSYGELRVVEYNGSSSLQEQLLAMRDTGVFMSVHTSNLANAPLLMPGSAVVEILQRHWYFNGLDTSFRDQTAMMGDIHHFAWRAAQLNETFYLDPADLRRFGHWTAKECFTEECVEAHTNVDVKVDIVALKNLLDKHLPRVFKGDRVEDAARYWPTIG